MLEGRCHSIYFRWCNAEPGRFSAPLGDGAPDFPGDGSGFGRGQIKILGRFHGQTQRRRRIVDRDRHREHAGAHIDRNGIKIVRRRQSPASAPLVEKLVISQVVVSVGGQHIEHDPKEPTSRPLSRFANGRQEYLLARPKLAPGLPIARHRCRRPRAGTWPAQADHHGHAQRLWAARRPGKSQVPEAASGLRPCPFRRPRVQRQKATSVTRPGEGSVSRPPEPKTDHPHGPRTEARHAGFHHRPGAENRSRAASVRPKKGSDEEGVRRITINRLDLRDCLFLPFFKALACDGLSTRNYRSLRREAVKRTLSPFPGGPIYAEASANPVPGSHLPCHVAGECPSRHRGR